MRIKVVIAALAMLFATANGRALSVPNVCMVNKNHYPSLG